MDVPSHGPWVTLHSEREGRFKQGTRHSTRIIGEIQYYIAPASIDNSHSLGDYINNEYRPLLPNPAPRYIRRSWYLLERICPGLSETLRTPLTVIDYFHFRHETFCWGISWVSKTWRECQQTRGACGRTEQTCRSRQIAGGWRGGTGAGNERRSWI